MKGSFRRGRCSIIRGLLMIAVASFSATLVHAAQFSVDAVKAAYLFRFAQYVEWPEAAPADAPFVIALTGADDVAVHLERLLPGMNIHGRRIAVRRVTRAQELDGVHILFVSAAAFSRTRALRERAIQMPILMVTETENGIDGGAIINFIEVDRNLRFEVSLNAADRSRLKVNSALLSVAARVERRPQGSVSCIESHPDRQRAPGCRIRMASLNLRSGA